MSTDKVFEPDYPDNLDYLVRTHANLKAGVGEAEILEVATQKLAAVLDVPVEWVLLTNSCTAALHLITSMDRDIHWEVPVYTWPSTWSTIPPGKRIFYDNTTGKATKSRGLILTTTFGKVNAPFFNSPLVPHMVLDAAQCFGAGIEQVKRGELLGTCFSFGPTKEVPCFRGGALVSRELAHWRNGDNMRRMSESTTDHRVPGLGIVGFNYRMDWINAIILQRQLERWEELREIRLGLLETYCAELDGYDGGYMQAAPNYANGHMAPFLCYGSAIRNRIVDRLTANGIATGHHYDLAPEHRAEFPAAAQFSDNEVTLPLHTRVTKEEVREICRRIRQC